LKKVLVICGATASGKTSLAVDCALSLNTEIISADSQLVYKGLNIGTAKPTEEEMKGVKHHMIDVVEPNEKFSVSDYESMASPILKRLLSDGRTPIICGGTGFYINSLLFDLSYGNAPANPELREKYGELLENQGKEALFEVLKKVDPETALKLHPNDTKRVIRALEIAESGKLKSELSDDGLTPKYDFVAVAINFPREELYARIEQRVDKMFDDGLIDEVKNLLNSGVDENCQSMQAIGYKEVVQSLKNGDLESTMRGIIKQNTRHYAKRQLTFFKKLPNLVWIDRSENLKERVLEILNG